MWGAAEAGGVAAGRLVPLLPPARRLPQTGRRLPRTLQAPGERARGAARRQRARVARVVRQQQVQQGLRLAALAAVDQAHR